MNHYPAISVVMPVYNTGQYVGEAIESILSQTFTDFEFIIVNDGSTDYSLEVISSFKDKRIRIINCKTNAGNYPARNKGHQIAKGKYICVMDSDDVSPKDRFEKQFLYMEANPEVGISGGGFRYYGREELFFRETEYENLKVILLQNNPFYHPALILQQDFIKKYNLRYNEQYWLAADYDLLVQGARYFPVTNIPEDIFHYRVHDQQNSSRHRARQVGYADEIRLEQVRYLGIEPDADEAEMHLCIVSGITLDYRENAKVNNWIRKVITANKMIKYYHTEKLEALFDGLLSVQPFMERGKKNYVPITKEIKSKHKIDLNDVTFMIILRIDSKEQIENTNTVIKYLTENFEATIRVLEGDKDRLYFTDNKFKGIQYEFVEDQCNILNRNKWLNKLIPEVTTPYVAVWDENIIAPCEQVMEAVEIIRSGEAVMCFPHDGRIYNCDKVTSTLFKLTQNTGILQKRSAVFELRDGFNSKGGAFFADRGYISAGWENENILNHKVADEERIKRLETFGLTVSNVKGFMFHLWHPGCTRRIAGDIDNEMNDIRELINTTRYAEA